MNRHDLQKKPERPELSWLLPKNLGYLRSKGKVTLDDVAYGSGLSRSHISQIENGEIKSPSVQVVAALARYFDRGIEEICFTNISSQ